eukprot:superscaffoldBa00005784_g20777
MAWVLSVSSLLNWLWSLKGGMINLAPTSSNSPGMRKPLSAVISSPGSSNSKIPDCLVNSLSEIEPVNNLEAKVIAPQDSDEMDPDLARLASLGFTGCLSVVHFNSISPLKAALLHPDTSPVVITGPLVQSNYQSGSVDSGQPLVNAIRTDSALIGGVIAVVIFVIVTGLAITARFLYQRKETYRNQEVKGVKQEDSQDFPFNNQTDSQNASSENPKEYFI